MATIYREVHKAGNNSSLLAVTCRLLIAFANSLDPDQDRQNVGPELEPNHSTLIVFMKEVGKK